MITQDELKKLLHYAPDTGVFTRLVATSNRIKVGDIAGNIHPTGYRHIKIKSKLYKAHRLAWLYVHGRWPSNQIDHRNRVRDANWIDNLRDVTHMQNGTNMCTNTSGVAGVHRHKQTSKWQAQIRVDGKQKHLGYFASLEDAAEARRAAELKYFGVNAL